MHSIARFSRRVTLRHLAALGAVIVCVGVVGVTTVPAQSTEPGQGLIQKGLGISPVPVNLIGKNPSSVAQGSYIVNTSGCNDCHTNPEFAPGGNPFLGEPEQINTAQFLAGGREFGPFISRNLTPNRNGRPAGLTYEQFVLSMRTGQDLKNRHPEISPLLQVMPWPVVAKHTNSNLRAIYDYLSAIPCLETAGSTTPRC